jgi:hypothetical protein
MQPMGFFISLLFSYISMCLYILGSKILCAKITSNKELAPRWGHRPWPPRPPCHRCEIPTRHHPLLPKSPCRPRRSSLPLIRLKLTPLLYSKFAQRFLPDGRRPPDAGSLLPPSCPRWPSSDGRSSVPSQPMSLAARRGVELCLPRSRPPAAASTPSPLMDPAESTRGG